VRSSNSGKRRSKSLVSTAWTKISMARANSAASPGVILPAIAAFVIAVMVAPRSPVPLTGGTSNGSGRLRRGGMMRSRQNFSAGPKSPSQTGRACPGPPVSAMNLQPRIYSIDVRAPDPGAVLGRRV
jgi:hypothetical protein